MPSQYEVDMKSASEFAAVGNGFPFGMLVSSIIVIVAAAIACDAGDCNGEGEVFALIGGILLFVLTAIYMCLEYNRSNGPNLNIVWVLLFFVCWGLLAGYTTFENPFFIPSNGYFAAWLGFFCATGMVVFNINQAQAWRDRFVNQGLPLCFIIAGSIIVIIAAIANGCCNADDTLAIIAGAVSLFLAILRILLADKIDPGFFAVFMFGWWLIMGLIITFRIFIVVGNGFFATWVCLASSMYLCFPSRFRR